MSAGDEVIYLDAGGRRRRYVLHTPPGAAEGPLPLVVMMDGRGGTPWTAMKASLWSPKADREGFLVCYPEALKLNPSGPQHFLDNPQMWNAGVGGTDVERPGVDDVAFLTGVLDDVARRRPVDAERVYLTGFSNGASMTFRMALELPERFAAIAPVAGHCRFRGASLRKPVPMVYFFGMLDRLSPFAGGEVELPWGGREWRPPARFSVESWVDLCGLPPEPAHVVRREGYELQRFGPNAAGAEVWYYAIEDLGHVWPGGHRLLPEALVGPTSDRVHATEAIWDFFRARARRL